MSLRRVLLLLVLFFFFAPATGSAGEADWSQADRPRRWEFPRDHGAHPEYRTEWWYFTGNLEDAAGRAYGYQLTLFRVGVRKEVPPAEDSPWSVRDLYLGHLAVTDGGAGRFYYAERVSRAGPGLAGASITGLDVWVLDWSARADGESIRVTGGGDEFAVELVLNPNKPVVLHGEGGRSRKGSRPGQASYYASITSLSTAGTLRLGAGAEPVDVRGVSWFDQEFGSNQLAENQAGWDWFSLHLDDGRDLMLYLLRRTDGTVEPASSGTLVAADGRAVHLPLAEFEVEVLGTWSSPHSNVLYPGRWQLRVPSQGIELVVEPILADQELRTEGSTGVAYWEGAVRGSGVSGGRPARCRGYVELTGYAGTLGGMF